MTSLFTMFVAGMTEVPVIDLRLIAHVSQLAVETEESRPAANADQQEEQSAPVEQTS